MFSNCIEWTGKRMAEGYGLVWRKSKCHLGHRLAWEKAFGPIPKGMCVLHKCDNPPCVNPEHLFLGTRADNLLDMCRKGRHWNQKKTHCLRGHEYTEENTYRAKKGGRECKQCMRDRDKKVQERRNANPELKEKYRTYQRNFQRGWARRKREKLALCQSPPSQPADSA